jgi:acyl-CoA synthetase (AMP-forming)/AMP-acid ligase II
VYAHDDIAAVQTYVKSNQVAFTYYGAGADSDTPVKTRVATHADVVASAAGAAQALAVTGSDVILTTAPVWTFTGLTASFLAGGASSLAKVVLAGRSFDAAEALAAAELHRPTLVVSTPEHVAAMSAEAAADAARPEGKKLYDGALARLRSGLVVTPAGAASAPGLLASAKLAPVEATKGVAKR